MAYKNSHCTHSASFVCDPSAGRWRQFARYPKLPGTPLSANDSHLHPFDRIAIQGHRRMDQLMADLPPESGASAMVELAQFCVSMVRLINERIKTNTAKPSTSHTGHYTAEQKLLGGHLYKCQIAGRPSTVTIPARTVTVPSVNIWPVSHGLAPAGTTSAGALLPAHLHPACRAATLARSNKSSSTIYSFAFRQQLYSNWPRIRVRRRSDWHGRCPAHVGTQSRLSSACALSRPRRRPG